MINAVLFFLASYKIADNQKKKSVLSGNYSV